MKHVSTTMQSSSTGKLGLSLLACSRARYATNQADVASATPTIAIQIYHQASAYFGTVMRLRTCLLYTTDVMVCRILFQAGATRAKFPRSKIYSERVEGLVSIWFPSERRGGYFCIFASWVTSLMKPCFASKIRAQLSRNHDRKFQDFGINAGERSFFKA